MLLGAIAIAAAAVGVHDGRHHHDSSTAVAAAMRNAPSCVPSHLNRSDVLPGTSLQVSPLPDSRDANQRTQISMLGAPASALSDISVSGSRTGYHSGRLVAYSQGDGASFMPSRPFSVGERVTVHGKVDENGQDRHFAFAFTVAWPDPIRPPKPQSTTPEHGKGIQSFVSRPDLTPTAISVTGNSASPGYVFAAPYSGPGQDGPMIFDTSGRLIWFAPVPTKVETTDLRVQDYEGKPALTWWQGYIPPQGFGLGAIEIADSGYHVIKTVHAGNGLMVDLHSFRIDPGDTASFTAFNLIHCDLSRWGGPRDGAVTDGVFQEVDLKTGAVRREWHSIDHVPLGDSYSSAHGTTTTWPWDFFHINSVQQEPSGNYLISARNTWTVYQISGQDGTVQWKLGGKHPSFHMGPGTRTAYQHDAVMHPDGTISIFDNGGVPKAEPQTRLIRVALDPVKRTATLISAYTHNPSVLAGSQGSFQALPDGNWFAGWGSEPYLSEYDSQGRMIWDARMYGSNQSYRGYLYPWVGTPSHPPAVAARPGAHGLTIYASWNGSTQLAGWEALAGPSPTALKPVAHVAISGFETAIPTSSPGPYVQVRALDASGAVIGTSPVTKG